MRTYLTVCVCLFGLAAAVAQAGIVRVDWAGGGEYLTIQEGISAASPGDTVLVAQGTYTGPLNRDINFAGKDLYLLAEDGPDITIIDCQGLGRGFVFQGGEPATTVIEGFSIANGSAGDGGAIHFTNASPTILDCIFTGNTAEHGGAMYCGLSTVAEIVSCEFTDNSASLYGGAVYSYLSAPLITKSDFSDNEAGISGGAISCKAGSQIYLSNCDFVGNHADDGGAVYIGTFDGGGEEAEEPCRILRCDFTNNSASRGGALFINGFSWVMNAYCTYDYNTATFGGAVYALTDYTRSLTVQNCTLCFNGAEYGGGIYAAGSSGYAMMVTQTIIAFGADGDAIHLEEFGSLSSTLCLAYQNPGGNNLYGTRALHEDPLFCGVMDGNYRLCENSLCCAENNPWGFLLGSTSRTCGPCDSPVEETSWGAIKAMYR